MSLTGKINSGEPANPTRPTLSPLTPPLLSRSFSASSPFPRNRLLLRVPSISVSLSGSNPSPRIHTTTLWPSYQASSNLPPAFTRPNPHPPPSSSSLSLSLSLCPPASSIDPSSLRGNRIPRRLHKPRRNKSNSSYSEDSSPQPYPFPRLPSAPRIPPFMLSASNETEGQG